MAAFPTGTLVFEVDHVSKLTYGPVYGRKVMIGGHKWWLVVYKERSGFLSIDMFSDAAEKTEYSKVRADIRLKRWDSYTLSSQVTADMKIRGHNRLERLPLDLLPTNGLLKIEATIELLPKRATLLRNALQGNGREVRLADYVGNLVSIAWDVLMFSSPSLEYSSTRFRWTAPQPNASSNLQANVLSPVMVLSRRSIANQRA